MAGLYFDQTLNVGFNHHQVDAGLRFYGLDYVFEKNILGLTAGYNYIFGKTGRQASYNYFFSPGLGTAFFHENKSTVELYFSQVWLSMAAGVQLSENWFLFSQLGGGGVFNKHTNYNLGTESLTTYFTYDVALGIKYFWRTPLSE
jgi:hypothetical protein